MLHSSKDLKLGSEIFLSGAVGLVVVTTMGIKVEFPVSIRYTHLQ